MTTNHPTGLSGSASKGSRPDAYTNTGATGIYFAHPEYVAAALPAFEESRTLLPYPVLDADPGYIEMYWRAWELCFDHLKQPPEGSPFVSNYLDEAFSDKIFQWDTVFMTLFARYGHHVFPAIRSLDNFYASQHGSGYICREIIEKTGEDFAFKVWDDTVNPPLFAWAEVESYRVTGDQSRFARVLPVLEKYAGWLELHRRKPGTIHGLFWNTPLGSGLDNIPLEGSGWVDMSCQMVLNYRSMAYIAAVLGEETKAIGFETRADEIAKAINSHMWNQEDGFYYNVYDDGTPQKVKAITGFWPMLSGVASHLQARHLLLALKDPAEFWRPMPFPALSSGFRPKAFPYYLADGGYWLGGVWAPTNVMVIKGLDRYGMETGGSGWSFDEFGYHATAKYLDGLQAVYKDTGTFWEYYAPEIGMRGNPSKPDFVGWTGCGPIQLLIENILGFRPEGANNSLTWQLRRIDRHGIQKLRFGETTVSLIARPRKSVREPAVVDVSTDRAFMLKVSVNDHGIETLDVPAGESTYVLVSRFAKDEH